jgi:hypothetical protein
MSQLTYNDHVTSPASPNRKLVIRIYGIEVQRIATLHNITNFYIDIIISNARIAY